jgi:hypothetical protein
MAHAFPHDDSLANDAGALAKVKILGGEFVVFGW